MQTYQINETFNSIQGEGIDTGKYSTFIRLSGCNCACEFCDTDFRENYRMSAEDLVKCCTTNVVITGGEPLLQDLDPLIKLLNRDVTIETNGTCARPRNRTKISLSPKIPRIECKILECTSLKILYPYLPGVEAKDWASFPAKYKSIQVIDPEKGIGDAMEALKKLPSDWRLGLQLQKWIKVK